MYLTLLLKEGVLRPQPRQHHWMGEKHGQGIKQPRQPQASLQRVGQRKMPL